MSSINQERVDETDTSSTDSHCALMHGESQIKKAYGPAGMSALS
jgi:hypothetical protein